jgi:thiol-disulfide isomerase/thioredoxin
MVTGLIALAVALAVASAVGLALRWRAGRFRNTGSALSATDLGEALGERATLVQFSTAFCAPCRPTRVILSQVAEMVPGVRHVEIDAAARLDLVRRLHIASTPTVLVLDNAGVIAQRASGQPRKADVIAALGRVIGTGGSFRQTGRLAGDDSRADAE